MHNLAFRFGWTMQDLEDKEGNPSGVTYGVMKEVLRLASEFDPKFIICCFDAGHAYRSKIFPDYKVRDSGGKQAATRDYILKQIPGLRKALRKLPVRIVRIKGEEADDIIAHYCRAKWLKGKRIVVSGDEDFLQLVNKKVSVFNTKKDILLTHKNFKKKIGCKASRWVDVKAMWGDSSDKIPGILGIGRVYAVRIMEKYKSIEQAVASMSDPDMPTAIRNLLLKVQDNWDIIYRNRKLIDLKLHKVKVGKKNIKVGHWDTEKFKKFCWSRGFKSLRLNTRRHAKIMTAVEKRSSGE